MEELAVNLKRLRKQAKLTQAALADQAGLPRATLAAMEQPGANPGLQTVLSVAAALGVGLEELVSPQPEHRFYVVPPEAQQEYRSSDGLFVARMVSPIASRGVQIQIVTMFPQCHHRGRPHPYGSQEYFHVQEGTGEMLIAGERAEIPRGHLIQFPGHQAHTYINPSTEYRVQALSVVVFNPG